MSDEKKIPPQFRSSIATQIKRKRKLEDPRKVDLSPSVIDLGSVRFRLARHFGFCFGVENAIDIAYRAVNDNPGRRIFLLSEMIHNPRVNADLHSRGVRFLRSPIGEQLVRFEELTANDVVIIPAFGTTIELSERLKGIGLQIERYDTTCPFVEKVWKRSRQLATGGFTIVIHGEPTHEETRATFSHAAKEGKAIVVRDLAEAEILARLIEFPESAVLPPGWEERCSEHFDPVADLCRIGVVNQTTMLSSETKTVSSRLKEALERRYGGDAEGRFADTRDTLCYATTENQGAIRALIDAGGDLAVVVGGYNSSNTFHLAELCARQLPTYYVQEASDIIDGLAIRHLNMEHRHPMESQGWLPEKRPVDILIAAGASCPDALIDEIITKLSLVLNVHTALEAVRKGL